MTKKFELESEEEKRRMTESYSATFESFVREKEVAMHKNAEPQLCPWWGFLLALMGIAPFSSFPGVYAGRLAILLALS